MMKFHFIRKKQFLITVFSDHGCQYQHYHQKSDGKAADRHIFRHLHLLRYFLFADSPPDQKRRIDRTYEHGKNIAVNRIECKHSKTVFPIADYCTGPGEHCHRQVEYRSRIQFSFSTFPFHFRFLPALSLLNASRVPYLAERPIQEIHPAWVFLMTEPAMQAPINRGALHLRFDLSDISGFVIRTKYLKDLVMNNFLNVCTAICTVLSGIKVIRMCKHMLSDTGCHAKTKI